MHICNPPLNSVIACSNKLCTIIFNSPLGEKDGTKKTKRETIALRADPGCSCLFELCSVRWEGREGGCLTALVSAPGCYGNRFTSEDSSQPHLKCVPSVLGGISDAIYKCAWKMLICYRNILQASSGCNKNSFWSAYLAFGICSRGYFGVVRWQIRCSINSSIKRDHRFNPSIPGLGLVSQEMQYAMFKSRLLWEFTCKKIYLIVYF